MSMYYRIEYECKEKGLEIEDLSPLLNIPIEVIDSWKKKNPHVLNIFMISIALDIHPYCLISGQKINKLTKDEERLIMLYKHADKKGKEEILKNAIKLWL